MPGYGILCLQGMRRARNRFGSHLCRTPDLLKKLPTVGKDLDQFSLETVQMFYNDARTAGFTLETSRAGSVK